MTSCSHSIPEALQSSNYVEIIRTKDTADIYEYLLNNLITNERYSWITDDVVNVNYLEEKTHNYVIVFSTSGRRTSFLTSFMVGNIDGFKLSLNIICGKGTKTHPPLKLQPSMIAKRHGCKVVVISSLAHLINFYRSVYKFSFKREDLVALGKKQDDRVKLGERIDRFHLSTIDALNASIRKENPGISYKKMIKKQNELTKLAEEYMNECLDGTIEPLGRKPCPEFLERNEVSSDTMRVISRVMHLLLVLLKNGYNAISEKGVDIPILLPSKRYRSSFSNIHTCLNMLKTNSNKHVNFHGYSMYMCP